MPNIRRRLKDLNIEELVKVLKEHSDIFEEQADEHWRDCAMFWVGEYLEVLSPGLASYSMGYGDQNEHITAGRPLDFLDAVITAQETFCLLPDDYFRSVVMPLYQKLKNLDTLEEEEHYMAEIEVEDGCTDVADALRERIREELSQPSEDELFFEFAQSSFFDDTFSDLWLTGQGKIVADEGKEVTGYKWVSRWEFVTA